jgi:hypothetical protein
LRKIAARSANGSDSHAGFAARAASIAFDTSDGVAFEYLAIAEEWDDGLDWVRMDEVLI